MKILHTADWHIGRTLYGRKRYDEFEHFLNWLADTIEEAEVEVLLVAGDVFDTTTPSNRAQQLYYRFLCRVAASCCRHIVITAGNHDSPTFLSAPRELLKVLGVHVVGSPTIDRNEEVFLLDGENGEPALLVCAVPYLRDRDLRVAEAGESLEEKERKILAGIRAHYDEVVAIAEQQRDVLGSHIPIVAMGHLFTAGGETVEGDGVRELYVGSLAHVAASIFPASINYLALGHLHVPQKIMGSEAMRYSGSPLPMGFGEAAQQKSVCLVEFQGTEAQVQVVPVPNFQQLATLRGDWATLSAQISALRDQESDAWLEVVYEGAEILPDLRDRLEAEVADSSLEILRIRNLRVFELVLSQGHREETLDDLNVDEVFERCMRTGNITDEQRTELLRAYQEIIISLHDEDNRAE